MSIGKRENEKTVLKLLISAQIWWKFEFDENTCYMLPARLQCPKAQKKILKYNFGGSGVWTRDTLVTGSDAIH